MSITATMVFEASELNRDEKMGNNILTIKKLSYGNKILAFISRNAIRHYLFCTLNRLYPEDWKEAAVTVPKTSKEAIQFDLKKSNILENAELDFFGYMSTEEGSLSTVRKAPLGITKALSFEEWRGDMAFYANPEMAKRSGTTPNPYQKEEFFGIFKYSVTIDEDRIGKDSWIISNGELEFSEGTLKISLEATKKKKNDSGKILIVRNLEKISETEYKHDKGKVIIKENDNQKTINFIVDDEVKEKRIKQILEVLQNGLVYHASTEHECIIPLFMIAAKVKIPAPIFHHKLNIDFDVSPMRITKENIEDLLSNEYIESIYLKDSPSKLTIEPFQTNIPKSQKIDDLITKEDKK